MELDKSGALLRVFPGPVVTIVPGPDLGDGGIAAGKSSDGAAVEQIITDERVVLFDIAFYIDKGEAVLIIAGLSVPDVIELAIDDDGADDKRDGEGKLEDDQDAPGIDEGVDGLEMP